MKNNRKIFIIGIFLVCISLAGVLSVDAGNPISNIVQRVSTTVIKKGTKRVAKSNSIMVRNQARKLLAKSMSKTGIHSFLEYSRNRYMNVMRFETIGLSHSEIKKSYKFTTVKTLNNRHFGFKRSKKLKYATERGEMQLPKGKTALRVKWNGSKYEPCQPINSNNPDFNRLILTERRKAISPYNQFATREQLKNYEPSIMEFGKEGSGSVLKRNMLKAMGHDNERIANGFGGMEAHHVVPKDMKEAKIARGILDKYKIDINSPENGIFLPSDANSIYKGTIHNFSR